MFFVMEVIEVMVRTQWVSQKHSLYSLSFSHF